MKLWAWVVALALGTSGFSADLLAPPSKTAQLAGVWVLNSPDFNLRLELTVDGRYTRTVRSTQEKRIEELESIISDNTSHISELAKRGELQRQLREKGPIPERFLDVSAIEYSDDPETLVRNVADVIDRGRKEFEQVLGEYGISFQHTPSGAGNPTNPPSRDTTTAHSLKSAEARDALQDMVRRGLIR